ncbi:hypothetical protein [Occultella aeris]|uniref:hypothetical protein n=1 Tax=Occultella aeris TaxID=2761496 RepID=UPI0012E9BC59|nr:hypothetical protein [Occultella aeris]
MDPDAWPTETASQFSDEVAHRPGVRERGLAQIDREVSLWVLVLDDLDQQFGDRHRQRSMDVQARAGVAILDKHVGGRFVVIEEHSTTLRAEPFALTASVCGEPDLRPLLRRG